MWCYECVIPYTQCLCSVWPYTLATKFALVECISLLNTNQAVYLRSLLSYRNVIHIVAKTCSKWDSSLQGCLRVDIVAVLLKSIKFWDKLFFRSEVHLTIRSK